MTPLTLSRICLLALLALVAGCSTAPITERALSPQAVAHADSTFALHVKMEMLYDDGVVRR